jgi:hypothetical protein
MDHLDVLRYVACVIATVAFLTVCAIIGKGPDE